MHHIKSFGLFESFKKEQHYDLLETLREVLKKYVVYPDIFIDNPEAWHCLINGYTYVYYANNFKTNKYETMSRDKYDIYEEGLSHGSETVQSMHFYRIVSRICSRLPTTGIVESEQIKEIKNKSPEDLMNIFKMPYFPCSVIQQVINNLYKRPEWEKIGK